MVEVVVEVGVVVGVGIEVEVEVGVVVGVGIEVEVYMPLETYLKEVKQRADAATPGPWSIHVGYDRFSSNPGPYGAYMEFGNGYNILVSSLSDETKRFISNSREDIPKLLSVIERMREAIEEFRLAHEHQPDLPHTRAMGKTYGWCDFCQTKVVWGKGYADSCISDCDKIAGG